MISWYLEDLFTVEGCLRTCSESDEATPIYYMLIDLILHNEFAQAHEIENGFTSGQSHWALEDI